MAPAKNNNDVVIEHLTQLFEENLNSQFDKIVDQQDKMTEKFDRLSEAYSNLLGRLVHVEAADFKTTISKVDSTLQKILLLDREVNSIEDTIKSHGRNIDAMKAKLDRLNMIMNIILATVALVVAPLLVNVVNNFLPKFGG